MGFHNQQLFCHAGSARERFDRIITVIENAKEQDDVESAGRLRLDVGNINFLGLDVGAESFPGQVERLATLGLEAVKSIPGADIEDAATRQVDAIEESRGLLLL